MTAPTEKQIAARVRNFKIWRLRGLWSQQSLLTGKRRDDARLIVDVELEMLGAEPETARQERMHAERIAKLTKGTISDRT